MTRAASLTMAVFGSRHASYRAQSSANQEPTGVLTSPI